MEQYDNVNFQIPKAAKIYRLPIGEGCEWLSPHFKSETASQGFRESEIK